MHKVMTTPLHAISALMVARDTLSREALHSYLTQSTDAEPFAELIKAVDAIAHAWLQDIELGFLEKQGVTVKAPISNDVVIHAKPEHTSAALNATFLMLFTLIKQCTAQLNPAEFSASIRDLEQTHNACQHYFTDRDSALDVLADNDNDTRTHLMMLRLRDAD